MTDFVLTDSGTAVLLAIIFSIPLTGIVWSITAGVVRLIRRRRERQVILTSMVFRRP